MAAEASGGGAVADAPPGPVAVLDSSVLVPVWSRLVLQRLAATARQRFRPVWSEWIIAETRRVLAWWWLAERRQLLCEEAAVHGHRVAGHE